MKHILKSHLLKLTIYFLLKISKTGAGLVAQRLSLQVLIRGPGVRWFRSWVQTWHHLASHACGRRPTYKVEEDGHGR